MEVQFFQIFYYQFLPNLVFDRFYTDTLTDEIIPQQLTLYRQLKIIAAFLVNHMKNLHLLSRTYIASFPNGYILNIIELHIYQYLKKVRKYDNMIV